MPTTLNLSTVELVSSLRTAPLNGSPSSKDYNSSQRETLADLASLADFINEKVLPLVNALTATAETTGLEGRAMYADTSDTTATFFDSVQSQPLTVADALRLLSAMLAANQQTLTDLNIEVSSLQERLSTTNQNDIAATLQNLSDNLNTVLGTLQTHTNQLQAFQTVRSSTGSIASSATTLVTVTWPAAMASDAYTVALSLEDASGFLKILGFNRLVAGTSIQVRVQNTDTSAHTGTINATAIADVAGWHA